MFFSTDRRGNQAEIDAHGVLQQLASRMSFDDAREHGDVFPFPHRFEDVAHRDVAGMFGAHFADGLLSMDPGTWSGPVSGAYGLHLVIVDRREEPPAVELERVREAVLREWREDLRQQSSTEHYAKIRAGYRVVVERPSWLGNELQLDGVETR